MTLLATQGRAALVAWLLGSLAVLVFFRRGLLLLLSIIVVLSLILFLPAVVSVAIEAFRRGEDITLLTGRVALWKHVVGQAGQSAQSLLLGYGYGASRLSLLEQLPGHWTHTHNAFLEALMGMGLTGMSLLTASFASAGRFLLRRLLRGRGESCETYVELLGMVTVVLVYSMSSAAVGGRLGITSFIYLSIVACCAALKLTGEV
jgi:O-antigen ligase